MGFGLATRAGSHPPRKQGSEGYELVNAFLFLALTGGFRGVRVGVGRLAPGSGGRSLPIG